MTLYGPNPNFNTGTGTVTFDVETGLALETPASLQLWPNWWLEEPEKYARLKMLREQRGIEVDDFPMGTDRIVHEMPVFRKAGT